MFTSAFSFFPVSSGIVLSLLILALSHEASTASLPTTTCNNTSLEIECYDCDSRYIKECENIKMNSSLPRKKCYGCCVTVLMQQTANDYISRTCIAKPDVTRTFSDRDHRSYCSENLCNKSSTVNLNAKFLVLMANIFSILLVSYMY